MGTASGWRVSSDSSLGSFRWWSEKIFPGRSWDESSSMRQILPGISTTRSLRRHYPYGPVAAHVLGYVAQALPEDAREAPLLRSPGFRIGRTAIEKRYNSLLQGEAGSAAWEVNASGRPVRELARRPPIGG